MISRVCKNVWEKNMVLYFVKFDKPEFTFLTTHQICDWRQINEHI